MNAIAVLSHLLDYPSETLVEHRQALLELVAELPVDAKHRQAVTDFIERRTAMDLFDWQSEYDSLFERGRSLSLLLFEHVHGESRDRGQAMVDLLRQYREAGLEISERELPDYLPLYLEFLTTQGEDNLKAGLVEIAHVLAVLACRLDQRESDYASILHMLLALSGARVELDGLHEQLRDEKPDYTPEAIDQVWEEEQVTFGPGAATDGCGSDIQRPSESQRRDQHIPVNWVEADTAAGPNVQRGA